MPEIFGKCFAWIDGCLDVVETIPNDQVGISATNRTAAREFRTIDYAAGGKVVTCDASGTDSLQKYIDM